MVDQSRSKAIFSCFLMSENPSTAASLVKAFDDCFCCFCWCVTLWVLLVQPWLWKLFFDESLCFGLTNPTGHTLRNNLVLLPRYYGVLWSLTLISTVRIFLSSPGYDDLPSLGLAGRLGIGIWMLWQMDFHCWPTGWGACGCMLYVGGAFTHFGFIFTNGR